MKKTTDLAGAGARVCVDGGATGRRHRSPMTAEPASSSSTASSSTECPTEHGADAGDR